MEKLEKEYAAKLCWGMVASIDLHDCNPAYISDPKKIEQLVIELCEHIKMKRHGAALIERFAEGELEGYSALQFIETSSVTMHFDEQKDRAFIDIFSCKSFDYQEAEKFCKQFLQAGQSKSIYYFRH